MDTSLTIIGRAELLQFKKLGCYDIPARIDTGAKTSSLWASDVQEQGGVLQYKLFAKGNDLYTGETITAANFTKRLVSSSTGHVEERYVVKHSVTLAGRTIHASFTLSNRATQAYPVLIGRNILRGKYLVDVKRGTPQLELERRKERLKQNAFSAQQTSDDKQVKA